MSSRNEAQPGRDPLIKIRSRPIDWDVSKEMFSKLGGDAASTATLDVGSRTGEKALYVTDGCGELTCIDMNSQARSPLSVVADATSLPFRSGSFDAVTMFHVIEHIADAEMAVREIRRVLKKGGFCILVTPNSTRVTKPYSVMAKLRFWGQGHRYPMNPDHVFEYTEPDLQRLMVGFTEYHIQPLFLGIIFVAFGRVIHIGFERVPQRLSRYCSQWIVWARND